MYKFKPKSSDSLDSRFSKPSTGVLPSVVDAVSTRTLISAPVVPAQTATLAGSSAPNGLTLTGIIDSVATAALVSNIASLPLTSELTTQPGEENALNTLAGALEEFSRNGLSSLKESGFAPVPILSLSDMETLTDQNMAGVKDSLPVPNATLANAVTNPSSEQVNALSNGQTIFDVSAFTDNAVPVLITALTDSEITVTHTGNTNVILKDFISQARAENYINTGTGTLTVTTSGANLSSLSLTGNVAFTAVADEVNTGITVSGTLDSSNVTLYLIAGASSKLGSIDTITLGDGNNLILDAGDGQVAFSFGNGTNVVMLTGVGVSGTISFANHSSTNGDFVTIAANGVATPAALASKSLVTISGLNNRPDSLDTITFLGDMGASLAWAGGDARASQVSLVSGDAADLVNWVDAAQTLASHAHSVAWFQFEGNTYVLESATGSLGNHAGDTLIRLTGLTQFTGDNGELAFGALHLAG